MLIEVNDVKTSAEVAVILKRTQEYIAWLCRNGKLEGAFKKGKTWLIPYEAIKIYILTYGNKKQKEQLSKLKQEVD